MIKDIIDVLRSDPFYGAGKYTEIAKGKYEMVTTLRGMKRKIKRAIKK
jgi:hypothetical protein